MRGNMLRPVVVSARHLFGDDAQDRAADRLGSPGFLQNWHRVATFEIVGGPNGNVFAPFSVHVAAEHAAFDISADACKVGLLWDDATVLEAKPVELQSGGAGETPGEHVFEVSSVRGHTLEVWTAGFDSFGGAELVSVAEGRQIEEAQIKGAKDAGVPKPPTGFSVTAGAVVGLVVVVVLLGVLMRARSIGG